jgi:hypothetical protein
MQPYNRAMSQISGSAKAQRDAAWLALLAALCLALGLAWEVWRLPPVSARGIHLLLLAGLGLAVLDRLRRPGWRMRAAGVGGLVGMATVLNLLWFPGIDDAIGAYGLQRQPDDRLLSRYRDNPHSIPRRNAQHLLMAEFLEGKPVRAVAGSQIVPWRLKALSRPSSIVSVPLPEGGLPSAWALLHDRPLRVVRSWGGGRQIAIGITEGAEQAASFVVVRLEGVEIIVPDSVWQEHVGHPAPRGR